MRTALRKMGNSTGMIIPKAILAELETEVGTSFDISVVDRKIVAAPVKTHPRAGWEESARTLAEAGDDKLVWPEFGTEWDAEWEW